MLPLLLLGLLVVIGVIGMLMFKGAIMVGLTVVALLMGLGFLLMLAMWMASYTSRGGRR